MKNFLQAVLLVVVLSSVVSCSKESLEEVPVTHAANVPAVEQALLGLVNDYRAQLGYEALAFSAVAYSYANDHTDYMIATGEISHYNFSARATSIAQEANATAVAENVAKDYPDAQSAFQGWINSEAHRKTIEGSFSHTAISVKQAPDGKLYFTQLFYQQ